MSLGTKLLKLRKELNLTQPEMARIVDVSQGTYCDWESDTTKPNFNSLMKLCSEFNLDVYEFLKDSEKTIINKNKNCNNSFNGYAENSSIIINSQDIIEILTQLVETQNEILKKLK